jgi:hypothetical protein
MWRKLRRGDHSTVSIRGAVTTCLLLAAPIAIYCLSSSVRGVPAPAASEDRQPRNIYELLYSIDHTFARVLKSDELKLVRARSPEEIRQTNPELYERVSQDVRAWTDLWIQHVRTTLVPLPEKRLNSAHAKAEQIDDILRNHFQAKKWAYRPLGVVFLPPQVFLDERHRGNITSGMFIPFYPDAIFVSVDWPVPMELVLVHEILHFNKTKDVFGMPLEEGLVETAARYLVVRYDLVTAYASRRVDTYPVERKGVDLVLEEIAKRTGTSRDEALELFLGAFLTGNQDAMNEVFGAETWERVIKLSQTRGGWQTHRIKKALVE